jgi:uncharacterized protein DUF3570
VVAIKKPTIKLLREPRASSFPRSALAYLSDMSRASLRDSSPLALLATLTRRLLPKFFFLGLLCGAPLLIAAVLPEERADVLYHRYQGGGLTVDGPSVLVRKNIADKWSVSGNYYVDNVSSASIDVVTQASAFSDKRTEKSLSVSYLEDRTLMTAGYIDSSESDYISKTFHFDISQDFFGDLTTFSMGYTRGSDTIKRNGDSNFEETATHQEYRVGLSQILTRDLIASISEEVITDSGYLSNPYRSYRFANGDSFAWSPEVFPKARTSSTTALNARYHLPNYRSAVYGNYRFYRDGWDVQSHTFEIGYDHTLPGGWLFDVHTRYYKQAKANFYSDLFERSNEFDYMTRDKQLSTFNSVTFGAGVSYEMPLRNNRWIDKASANLYWDHIQFNFDDYRDARVKDGAPGDAPLYSYNADVIRFFLTVWY